MLAFLFMLLFTPAHARDDGQQWAQSPHREWMRGLRNKNGPSGEPCCDDADGNDVDMVDVREGEWWVRVQGKWLRVPPYAKLDVPNRLGYARAWTYVDIDGVTRVRCFLPGALG